jgi:hypothetical protein
MILICTVDIFSGKPGESAQLRFASKNSGEFLSIWANFVNCSAEVFADLRKFRPNRKKFARNFWGESKLRGLLCNGNDIHLEQTIFI